MKRLTLLIILITSAFMMSTQSLKAQEEGNSIKPYGNLYVFFGYLDAINYSPSEQKERDRDTFYTINDNSNLGFNFRYSRYSGVFELGISDAENDHKVKVRKAYGIYNFGFGELMIGQSWTPYTQWSHEAANYYRSEGFGALYDDLITQLKLTWKYGLYVDIIKPYVPTKTYYKQEPIQIPSSSSDPTITDYNLVEVERELTTGEPLDNIQSLIPKIAIGYEYNENHIVLGAGAAGNAYRIKKTETVEFTKEWIISYLAYAYSQLGFGDYSVNFSGGFSVNPANFGLKIQSQGNSTYQAGAAAAISNISTGKYEIKDTWNAQAYIEFGWVFLDNYTMHAGYGFSATDYPVDNTDRDYAMEYYLNVKVNVGNLIALTPSVSYRDYMKDMAGMKEGYDIYGGVLATVSFY